MKFRSRFVSAEMSATIVRRMIEDGWKDADIARFLNLWHQSNQTVQLLAWLARPMDELDRKTLDFLRPFLIDEER